MELINPIRFGFVWDIEHFDVHGKPIYRTRQCNLVPLEGLNYMLATGFRGGAQQASWFVGLYEGNYTPVTGVTAATLPATATETSSYTAATRVAWTTVAPTIGELTNVAARAEFVSNVTKTIYGGFISSSAPKGSTTGVLGSVVRFASPQVFTSGNTIRITAGIVLVSV